MDEYSHRPVLLAEVIDALAVASDGVYMDLTYGRGGHAAEILARLGAGGRLIVMDKDPAAIRAARERFAQEPRATILHGSYAGAAAAERGLGADRRHPDGPGRFLRPARRPPPRFQLPS